MKSGKGAVTMSPPGSALGSKRREWECRSLMWQSDSLQHGVGLTAPHRGWNGCPLLLKGSWESLLAAPKGYISHENASLGWQGEDRASHPGHQSSCWLSESNCNTPKVVSGRDPQAANVPELSTLALGGERHVRARQGGTQAERNRSPT